MGKRSKALLVSFACDETERRVDEFGVDFIRFHSRQNDGFNFGHDILHGVK